MLCSRIPPAEQKLKTFKVAARKTNNTVLQTRDFWFASNYILEHNSIYSKPLFNTLKKCMEVFMNKELLNGKHLFSP